MAEALWYSGPGQAEIRQEALAPPGRGRGARAGAFGAVSRGTEALVLAGRVPESEFERMRAPFMAGNFPFPVKYGYATVGRIEGGAGSPARAHGLHAPPAPEFLQHPGERRRGAAGKSAAATRGAGRQYGDRAQRGLGCGAWPGRPHRRRRGRRGRLSGRVFVRAASRRGGDARRYQPGARGIGASPWGWLCTARTRQRATAISWFTPAAMRPGLARRSRSPARRQPCLK